MEKFKPGDTIRHIVNHEIIYTISKIDDFPYRCYNCGKGIYLDVSATDKQYELLPNTIKKLYICIKDYPKGNFIKGQIYELVDTNILLSSNERYHFPNINKYFRIATESELNKYLSKKDIVTDKKQDDFDSCINFTFLEIAKSINASCKDKFKKKILSAAREQIIKEIKDNIDTIASNYQYVNSISCSDINIEAAYNSGIEAVLNFIENSSPVEEIG